jgi:hypothetical protein
MKYWPRMGLQLIVVVHGHRRYYPRLSPRKLLRAQTLAANIFQLPWYPASSNNANLQVLR